MEAVDLTVDLRNVPLSDRLLRLGFSHRSCYCPERYIGRRIVYHVESLEVVGLMNFVEALSFLRERNG
jgi:hypothetical protein